MPSEILHLSATFYVRQRWILTWEILAALGGERRDRVGRDSSVYQWCRTVGESGGVIGEGYSKSRRAAA